MNGENTETYYAEMEAARNEAEDAYFNARPQLADTIYARTLFREGFERGFRIRALMEERYTLANDAAKYRWAINNSCWIRGEHAAYVAIPVAREADLSCVAMRDAAIDDAMAQQGGRGDE